MDYRLKTAYVKNLPMATAETSRYQIEVLLDESAPLHLKARRGKLVDDVVNLVAEASDCLSGTFWTCMDQYQAKNGELHPALLGHLKQTCMDLPRFTIADKPSSRKMLDDFEFKSVVIEDRNLLVSFQLPKPVALFWRKTEHTPNWRDGVCTQVLPVIGWGSFCRPLYQRLNRFLKETQRTHQVPLSLLRINHRADHEPQSYYYLWEIGYPRNCAGKKYIR